MSFLSETIDERVFDPNEVKEPRIVLSFVSELDQFFRTVTDSSVLVDRLRANPGYNNVYLLEAFVVLLQREDSIPLLQALMRIIPISKIATYQKFVGPTVSWLFRSGLSKKVIFLLNAGFPINFYDTAADQSLFHAACAGNQLSIVKDLIKRGANQHVIDSYGFTPIYHTINNDSVECFDYLLATGNRPNLQMLKNAIYQRSHKIIGSLYRRGFNNFQLVDRRAASHPNEVTQLCDDVDQYLRSNTFSQSYQRWREQQLVQDS